MVNYKAQLAHKHRRYTSLNGQVSRCRAQCQRVSQCSQISLHDTVELRILERIPSPNGGRLVHNHKSTESTCIKLFNKTWNIQIKRPTNLSMVMHIQKWVFYHNMYNRNKCFFFKLTFIFWTVLILSAFFTLFSNF